MDPEIEAQAGDQGDISNTYEGHGAVVGEEVLDLDAPVRPQFEVPGTQRGFTHEAAPRIHILQNVEGPQTHQDLQTALTETPGGDNKIR